MEIQQGGRSDQMPWRLPLLHPTDQCLMSDQQRFIRSLS